MADAANIRSIESLREFEAVLVQFYDIATRSASNMQQQSQRMMQWLELDRPGFWKRQVEIGHHRLAEARTRLTQCKMRRTGDFRPSCFDEKKALEKAKRDLEYSRRQMQVVKQWAVKARHDVEEFTGRQAQLTRMLEGDVPRMCALLQRLVQKLERYTTITSAEAMSLVEMTMEEVAEESGEGTAAAEAPTEGTN